MSHPVTTTAKAGAQAPADTGHHDLVDTLTRSLHWLTDHAIDCDDHDSDVIAQIRSDLETAITAVSDARDLLRHALKACNEQPRHRLRSFNCTTYDLAVWIEGWLRRNGGAS